MPLIRYTLGQFPSWNTFIDSRYFQVIQWVLWFDLLFSPLCKQSIRNSILINIESVICFRFWNSSCFFTLIMFIHYLIKQIQLSYLIQVIITILILKHWNNALAFLVHLLWSWFNFKLDRKNFLILIAVIWMILLFHIWIVECCHFVFWCNTVLGFELFRWFYKGVIKLFIWL